MFEHLQSCLKFRRLRSAKRDANKWLREARRMVRLLEDKQGELRGIRRLFNDTFDEAMELTEQTHGLIDKYESTMDALRNKVEVLEETLVPELVAAHRLVLERSDADIAVQIRRRVGNEVNERE